MSIRTIFAHVCCTNLETSEPWYQKLFGRAPIRRPTAGSVEFQFAESAEVHLSEEPHHAGHTDLTLGVLPLEAERQRLESAGLEPGPIEATDGYFTMHIRDPDHNLIVFASAQRS